jgi:hypothetical protein
VQAAATEHEGSPHAVYKLRLLDPDDTTLIERTLTLTPVDDHSQESENALFSDLFAKPAGQVATIQLLADATAIYTVTPGINLPTVTVQQPAGGAVIEDSLTIGWTANDPDPDDRLLFTVQYSHDNGASWHTLAINVPSTPDPTTSLTLSDLGSLHGSAPNSALIRVLATDGYNTAIDMSEPFTVQNRPPLPVIITPAEGQTFAGGQAVVLQGSATDPEDGGLGDDSLRWQLDGIGHGSGAAVTADGLTPGAHTAALAATDATSQTVTTTVSFDIAPLTLPLTSTEPLLDGFCEDGGYAVGANLHLKPYGDGAQASVQVLRSDDHLWVCFSGLQKGALDPGAYVGVRADSDYSRDPQAQPTDTGFFVGENGGAFTRAGDGAGDFGAPSLEGVQAVVSAITDTWTAELRMDKAAFNGWEHRVGLSFGHHSVAQEDDDYPWPYSAQWANPATWATTALGSQPVITALDPFSATVLGPSFTLTVTGSGFVSGTQALWNGSELPTTFVDDEHLTVQVATAQLDSAALVQVKTRGPAPAAFESNELPFVVAALQPEVTSLSPQSVLAESSALTLTVAGSHFAADAQVLWNGTPLPTQFISSTQVKAQVEAALLVNGQTVGVAVRNPTPDATISPVVPFEVQPNTDPDVPPVNPRLYLPMIEK